MLMKMLCMIIALNNEALGHKILEWRLQNYANLCYTDTSTSCKPTDIEKQNQGKDHGRSQCTNTAIVTDEEAWSISTV